MKKNSNSKNVMKNVLLMIISVIILIGSVFYIAYNDLTLLDSFYTGVSVMIAMIAMMYSFAFIANVINLTK